MSHGPVAGKSRNILPSVCGLATAKRFGTVSAPRASAYLTVVTSFKLCIIRSIPELKEIRSAHLRGFVPFLMPSLSITKDDRRMFLGGENGTFIVIDTASLNVVRSVRVGKHGSFVHVGPVLSVTSAAYIPVLCDDEQPALFDTKTLALVTKFGRTDTTVCAVHPKFPILATWGHPNNKPLPCHNVVQLWEK